MIFDERTVSVDKIGFLIIINVNPMETPPSQPWLNTDSMSSVLIKKRMAPEPAKIVVVNVFRRRSSIPNMSFLTTA